jgi:hypothetical protein
LVSGQLVRVNTTGALPTPLVIGQAYYVASPTGTTFSLASVPGGPAITFGGAGTGTHTLAFGVDDVTIDLAMNGNAMGAFATATFASAGTHLTATAHGLSVGNMLALRNQMAPYYTGALPSNLTQNTIYWVQSVVDADTLTISATSGGAAITFASAGTGTNLWTQASVTFNDPASAEPVFGQPFGISAVCCRRLAGAARSGSGLSTALPLCPLPPRLRLIAGAMKQVQNFDAF